MSKNAIALSVGAALFVAAGVGIAGLEHYFDPGECQAIATQQQAGELLTSLLPAHQIKSAEPLDLGGGPAASGCLLEVDLLANKEDEASRGYVYVLPGAKHFLNGPLYDKRSKIAESPKQPESMQRIADALSENQKVIRQLNERIDNVSQLAVAAQQPSTTAATPTPASQPTAPAANSESAADLRAAILARMQTLPAIKSTGDASAQSVYVLVDPLCVNCAKLAERSESIARAHGIRWHWLPMFTNEKGWVLSTLALKIAQADEAAGEKLLHDMMSPSWDPTPYKDTIAALGEEDYARAKENLLLFHEMTTKNPQLGTPLVVFQRADGGVEIISGVPTDPDWAPLKN